MRRLLIAFAVLAVVLPMAARADIITVANHTGTIAISGMSGTGGLGTIGVSAITSKGSRSPASTASTPLAIPTSAT